VFGEATAHEPSWQRHFFVASDGSIPYRTSWALVPRYTGAAVARFLEHDFRRHGPPLVIRLDRATQHETAVVKRALKRHKVLALHGPPNRPTYYGQLERQNAEHREWLSRLPHNDQPAELATKLAATIDALNRKWRRRELSWKTAWEVWNARLRLTVNRSDFAEEVTKHMSRLGRLEMRARPADLAERLAIEHTLACHRLLIRQTGGWC
jgi:hypothetical protein